ncbi:hypothetical protein V2J09_009341 [Rumex salicifolius]
MSMGKTRANEQLFDLLSSLVKEVESMTNEEEVELRAKIEVLQTEVTKVPSQSSTQLDEMEIAKELDRLSSKLEEVNEAISREPQVKSLLSGTADIWMPVITATSDERREFATSIRDGDGTGEHH